MAFAEMRDPKNLRVLLVEDSEDILFIMKTELEWAGLDVETASDGLIGLELAKTWQPHVIVSDIHMPGLDGIEFIERVRRLPTMANTPAIALTGTTEQRALDEFLSGGFNAIATKPVDPENLLAMIQRISPKTRVSGA